MAVVGGVCCATAAVDNSGGGRRSRSLVLADGPLEGALAAAGAAVTLLRWLRLMTGLGTVGRRRGCGGGGEGCEVVPVAVHYPGLARRDDLVGGDVRLVGKARRRRRAR